MSSAEPITILPPKVEERGDLIRVSYPVRGLEPDTLWFDVSAEFADFVDDGCDAALMALLASIMESGRPLRIEGPVSERLLWGLRNTVSPLTQRVLPYLRAPDIEACSLRRHDGSRGDAVLTGLSCGVDSFALLREHFVDSHRLPGFAPTHFVFAHIGHHGYGDDTDARAGVRWKKAQAAARELGRPILWISSNTPEFYSKRYDEQMRWASIMTLRMVSIPLLLQRGAHRFLIGSSNSLDHLVIAPHPYLTVVDPIIVPALSTERVDIQLVGAHWRRVEKTEQIADWDLARRHLNVCIMEGENCSRCSKCLRTLLALEVLGRLDEFGGVFDLETYRAHRIDFIAEVLADDDENFLVELRTLTRERGFVPPRAARARAVARRARRLVPVGIRRGARALVRPVRQG